MKPEPFLPQRHLRPSVVMTGVIVTAAALSLGQPAMTQTMTTGLMISQNGSDLMMLEGESKGVRITRLRQHRFETPLREGDLITQADGIVLALPEDLFGSLRTRPTLESVSLVVLRGEAELILTIRTDLLIHFMPPAPPVPPEIPS